MELSTFLQLRIVMITCYNIFTSKQGADLFQIIQSVHLAFVQNASEFQDISVEEFQI